MLNKNQSHKRNIWKYTLVIPALIAFVILFQVKVVAQQKETSKEVSSINRITIEWSKRSTNEEIESDINYVKNTGVLIKYSKVKRNNNGEIIALNLKISDKKGNTNVINLENNQPIKPILIIIDLDKDGQGSFKYNTGIEKKNLNDDDYIQNDSIPEVAYGYDAGNYWSVDRINEDSNDYLIIIDGKKQKKNSKIKIPLDREMDKMDKITDNQLLKKYGEEGKNGVILITTKKVLDELKPDDIEIIDIKKGIKTIDDNSEIILNDKVISKNEMDKIDNSTIETVSVTNNYGKKKIIKIVSKKNINIDDSKNDIEQARLDSEQAKLDIEQAKKDAEQAKLDAEQARKDAIQARKDAIQARKDAIQARNDALKAAKSR